MTRITGRYLLVIEDEQGTRWRNFSRNRRNVFEVLGKQPPIEVPCDPIDGQGKGFTTRFFAPSRSTP